MDAPNREVGKLAKRARAEVEITFTTAAGAAIHDPDSYGPPVCCCSDGPATDRVVVRVSRCAGEAVEKCVRRGSDEIVGPVRLSTSAETRFKERCISGEHFIQDRLTGSKLDSTAGAGGQTQDRSRHGKDRENLESDHYSEREGVGDILRERKRNILRNVGVNECV